MSLGTLFSDFLKAGKTIEKWIGVAASDAPTIIQDVTADEGKIQPVLEAFLPGVAAAAGIADSVLDKIASAIEAAGPAAAQAGLSVPLDQATVVAFQQAVAAAKAAPSSISTAVKSNPIVAAAKPAAK
jgi:hypothetical protein